MDYVKEACPPLEKPLSLDGGGTNLEQLLRTPLVRPIPIEEGSYEHLAKVAGPQQLSQVFQVADESGSCEILDQRFAEMLFNSSSADGSEDMVHGLIDACILHPLRDILHLAGVSGINFQRNQVASTNVTSHTSGVRPDVYLWASNFLLLVGEENKSGTHPSKASSELKSKLDGWSPILMGTSSFLFGFGVSGPNACFYAFNDTLGPFAITPTFNLSQHSGRFALIPVLFQLVRALRYQVSLKPDTGWGLLQPIGRERTIITFHMKKVVIKFTKGQQIRKLLEMLVRKPIECLIRPTEISRKGLTVVFEPLGLEPVRPTSSKDCRAFLRCMLTALDGLHRLGWCHNDIRWLNTISDPKETNRWILIDLDHATKNGATVQLGDNPKASVQRDLKMLRGVLEGVVDDPAILPQASFWDGSPTASDLLRKLGTL